MGLILRIGAAGLVASALLAGEPGSWVPARWAGGPLEVFHRQKTGRTPDAALGRILSGWYSPRTLDLLRPTPVNCLLVTWSAGADAAVESQQRQLVTDYARAARQRGISVLGVVYEGADPVRSAAAAAEAGLEGIVLEGSFDFSSPPIRDLRAASRFPVVPLAARARLLPDADWPVLGVADAVTPGVRVLSESGSATATPSSEPWIDSNLWLVRLLRSGHQDVPVWLSYQLENPAPPDYARAIADAAAAGGRWIVAPDDLLLAGLWRGDAAALAAWRQVGECLRFHEQHRGWRAFIPAAVLGIVQDRAATDRDIFDESLNLITRRRIPYRLIRRAALSGKSLEGLQAVLATDLSKPGAAERERLAAFVQAGGLLVGGPAWMTAAPAADGYSLFPSGKGRLAAYKEDPPDPESLARDLLDLIGNESLPVRLYNVPSVLPHIAVAPDGGSLLVELVNYATAPAERVTLRAAGAFRGARLFSPGAPAEDLKITQSGGRVNVRIASIGVYAAVLLEK